MEVTSTIEIKDGFYEVVAGPYKGVKYIIEKAEYKDQQILIDYTIMDRTMFNDVDIEGATVEDIASHFREVIIADALARVEAFVDYKRKESNDCNG